MITLHAGRHAVADYVTAPDLAADLVPRPYLHPVRTLAGTVVTDLLPEDHRWHLGASLAMPDVAGTNLWGGRSYVHGQGYVPLDDHGRIEHTGWRSRADDAVDENLRWTDPAGATLLLERRTLRAEDSGDGRSWLLTVATALTNPGASAVELRSPAVNGRGEGAGYGGYFWRLPQSDDPQVTAGQLHTEDAVNGSAQPSLTVSAGAGGAAYSLTFSGLQDDDRWFVRIAEYPGVGAALAFQRPLVIAPGETVSRRYQVLVSDGRSDAAR